MFSSLNQTLPSGPVVISDGRGLALVAVSVNSFSTPPLVLIRPILPAEVWVNQRVPSGPDVMPHGSLPGIGRENSLTLPFKVILATKFSLGSVNQRFPSGPGVIL